MSTTSLATLYTPFQRSLQLVWMLLGLVGSLIRRNSAIEETATMRETMLTTAISHQESHQRCFITLVRPIDRYLRRQGPRV